jgi:hypothetical protein
VKEAQLHRRDPGAQAPFRQLILSGIAHVLLHSAIVCIRSMQWFYKHGIISFDTALRLLRLAQWLDRSADAFANTQPTRLRAHDES